MAKKNTKTKKKTKKTTLKVARLAHGKGLPLPAYQSKEAAGVDLVAAVPENKPIRLKPGARALIPTGLCFELACGFEAQVRPRSGLALKSGVTVLNTPGTIDSDYRGEVQVILINLGDAPFIIRRGERIAQLVVAPVIQAKVRVSKKLAKSKRGTGGFGSTGSRASKAKGNANTKPKTRSETTAPAKSASKSKSRAKTRSKPKSSKTKAVRRSAKTSPRIAAKSKSRAPVKRKATSTAKAKSVRRTTRGRGAGATKTRTRKRSTSK